MRMPMRSCSGIKPHEDNNSNLHYFGQRATQWRDNITTVFTKADRKNSIILFGGMTTLHDKLAMSALESEPEKYVALPNPDFESFRIGKAFGNRGQCNPTYFTVGNLIKYLKGVQAETGMSNEAIVKKYAFGTANGCGPCRFGMYVTEYRKALSDAGYKNFRIVSFQHNKLPDSGENSDDTLHFPPSFFIRPIRAVMVGDIMTLLAHKIRPYETEKGATDRAIDECHKLLSSALKKRKSLLLSLWQCRKIVKKVKLDRLQVKPKVMIVGEFWAAMTEGDGNYNLHRFLEAEGAEAVPQPIINRLLLSIWEAGYFADKELDLENSEMSRIDFSSLKRKAATKIFKVIIKAQFTLYAKAIGLHGYELPNIEKLAKLSEVYFPLDAEGGENHMEVAHLLESIEHNLAHLVISVKPFGCMPSSAVSDGIQSLVTSRYPSANFLSIETSGEGAANFYSRVQMALFKAKQSAKEEFEAVEKPQKIPDKLNNYLYQPKSIKAGTAAGLLDNIR